MLGHQPAGIYESRERAAYWDGRNQLGEKIASGLYFYTITAGTFTANTEIIDSEVGSRATPVVETMLKCHR